MSSDREGQRSSLIASSRISPRNRRTDCGPCVRRKETCDRAHPLCTACELAGLQCTTAASKLTWKPGFSLTRRPFKKRRAVLPRTPDSSCTFILEHPAPSGAETPFESYASVSGESANPGPSSVSPEQGSQPEHSSSPTSIVNNEALPSPATLDSAISPLDPVLYKSIHYPSLAQRYQPVLEQCKPLPPLYSLRLVLFAIPLTCSR